MRRILRFKIRGAVLLTIFVVLTDVCRGKMLFITIANDS